MGSNPIGVSHRSGINKFSEEKIGIILEYDQGEMMRYLFILLMVIFGGGCGTIQSLYTKPAEHHYDVISMAAQEKLNLADLYFKDGKYDKAIVVYKEFEKLHPNNKDVPYSILQQGLSYYKRKSTIDRDPIYTTRALEEFNRLKRKFPKYTQVDPYIVLCRKDLAEYEFYVAEFYFKSKHYPAAKARYGILIKDYPESVRKTEAQKKIEECKILMTIKPKPILFGLFDAKW
jgi:outer membrane protein assembly factor BamD